MIAAKFIGACFFLAIGMITFGQNTTPSSAPKMYDRFDQRVDSLKKELAKFPKPDTSRLKILKELLDQATFVKEREAVLPYYIETKQLAKKLNKPLIQSGCMYFIANLYKGKKIYDSAVLYADSGMYFIKNIPDDATQKLYAKCSRLKGQVYFTLEDYEGAIPHYLEALNYFEKTKENEKCFLYKDISLAYLNILNQNKRIEYAEKYCKAADEIGAIQLVTDAYLNLAKAFLESGDEPKARALFERIRNYFPVEKEHSLNAAFYMQQGIYFRLAKKYDSSAYVLNKGLQESIEMQHDETSCHVLQELFTTSMAAGDVAPAGSYAHQHLQLAEKGRYKAEQLNAWHNLSTFYASSGNYKHAYTSLENSNKFRDSLATEENARQLNMLEARYQFQKKQNEIVQLQKQKSMADALVKKKSILNKIFIVSIAVLALIFFLGYRNFKNKQALHRQQEEIQAQKIRELEKDKQLTAASFMMKGQEEERSRLAKDLHDGLGGLLSGVKHSILNMKENMILTEENTRAFERSVEMIDKSVKELRRVAHNMMPEALAKFGLADAIRDYCKTINASGAITITYQNFGTKENYDKAIETSVYRIIQELINNAIKHANATEVLVQTVCNDDRVSIAVEDNGQGFDQTLTSAGRGAGWTNIRSRVDYLKGSIDIKSEKDKGTSVNIELQVS